MVDVTRQSTVHQHHQPHRGVCKGDHGGIGSPYGCILVHIIVSGEAILTANAAARIRTLTLMSAMWVVRE